MSFTYGNVDGSADVGAAVRWQDRIDQWPQIRRYKERIATLLTGASPVVDVGCGPGSDVRALGRHRCVGIDASVAMCRAARDRGAATAVADAASLPLPDRRLGGVLADRVLQHVERPGDVLAEMVRVLRPGGRLVVADPDQATLVIQVPGVRAELVERVTALRRDVGYRNGRFVGTLPALLPELGLVDATSEPFALSLTDPDDAFGLPGWVRFWREEGAFSAADIAEWDAGVERGRAGGFAYSVRYFVVSGVRLR